MFSSHLFWTSNSLEVSAGVTQDFSSTFLLRCVPLLFSGEGFSRCFPSSTVKSNLCTNDLIVLHYLLGIFFFFSFLDRFLWEHKVARKVKVFLKLLVGNFCQYHFRCTLIMGRRKFCARDWWSAEACWWNDVSAVVTLIPEKVATSWKEFPAAKTFRAAHTCRSQQQQRRAADGV